MSSRLSEGCDSHWLCKFIELDLIGALYSTWSEYTYTLFAQDRKCR